MNLVRATVFAAAALILGGGYLASQAAYVANLNAGTHEATKRYVESVDESMVRYVALLVLVACVVLALLPQREAGD